MLEKLSKVPAIAHNLNFVDSAYPVTQKLYDLFKQKKVTKKANGPQERQKLSRLSWRSEIISEKLCDDILRYLSPTLDAYKGTTIIDVNPGACIWSAKVHEYLKPRCHLLMEPDKKYYEPFIQPLLEQPDSRYRYTTLSGANARSYFGNYINVLNDSKLLPPRPKLSPDDPKLREIDTSLLVIGNLWRRDHKRVTRDVKITPLVMQHMTYAALANELFHTSGLIRMLWWMPEQDILELLSSNVVSSKAITAGLSVGSEIVQVVGTKPHDQIYYEEKYYGSRPRGLQSLSAKHLPETTQKLKARTKVERDVLLTMTPEHDSGQYQGPNPLETSLSSFEELQQEVDAFLERTKSFERSSSKLLTTSPEEIEAGKKALLYPQSFDAVKGSTWTHRIEGSQNRALRIARAVDLYLQLYHLEAELAALSEQNAHDAALPKMTALVLSAGQQLDASMDQMPSQVSTLTGLTIEHLREIYTTPPTLPRDRRPFEPLKHDPSETWPQHNMALAMVTPKSYDFALPGVMNRQEGARTCQELMKLLFYQKAVALPVVLNRIAFGAAEALIPQVPAIADIRKGGRLDPMRVKPRDLSSETLTQLVTAFCDWPFKPSNMHLILASASESDEESQESQRSEDE